MMIFSSNAITVCKTLVVGAVGPPMDTQLDLVNLAVMENRHLCQGKAEALLGRRVVLPRKQVKHLEN